MMNMRMDSPRPPGLCRHHFLTPLDQISKEAIGQALKNKTDVGDQAEMTTEFVQAILV